jgi:hypothetical protein
MGEAQEVLKESGDTDFLRSLFSSFLLFLASIFSLTPRRICAGIEDIRAHISSHARRLTSGWDRAL